VNSIRARTDRLVAWMQRSDVDVLAVQETKCRDDQFPYDAIRSLGYQVHHHGLSAWNGVALISRVGLEDVVTQFPGQPRWGSFSQPRAEALFDEPEAVEARALGATCGGVRVWSLYVPNGRTLDDPHYLYKLEWLARLRSTALAWLEADSQAQIMLAGDWNIAPQDDDVWDMAAFEGSTHVSEPEREAFRSILAAGYADVVRPYAPDPHTFTYWDYQRLRFPRREGMRLDFALCSPALAARVTDGQIDRQERKGKGASDHAPVIVTMSPSP